MFDTKVDALLHVAVADLLIDDHTHRRLGDVVDNSSFTDHRQSMKEGRGARDDLPMVEFVRHALVDGTVALNVHNVSDLVGLEIRGQSNHALFAEIARKEVASSRAKTKRVRHLQKGVEC